MSSTNKTTNYELSQFIETDKPAWLTDYNSDMRKLDTALKGVSDVADGASGDISSLTDRMTAAEGAISTNANDIDALEARADALEAGAQSTAGTIAGIQTEQTVQNMGIEAATELGYNLARPYDSASTYAVGAYVLFQNTLYKCVTAIATGEAFDPTKWLAIKATDEISAGGSGAIITELTADNFSLTVNTSVSSASIEDNSTGTNTPATLSNPAISLAQSRSNFIARIGNLVILSCSPVITFSNISTPSEDTAIINLITNIPNILPVPAKSVYGISNFPGNGNYPSSYKMVINPTGNRIEFNFTITNRRESALNISGNAIDANFVLIYTV